MTTMLDPNAAGGTTGAGAAGGGGFVAGNGTGAVVMPSGAWTAPLSMTARNPAMPKAPATVRIRPPRMPCPIGGKPSRLEKEVKADLNFAGETRAFRGI